MREDAVDKLLELITQGDAAREELDKVINEIWNHICIISKPYEFEANKKFPLGYKVINHNPTSPYISISWKED